MDVIPVLLQFIFQNELKPASHEYGADTAKLHFYTAILFVICVAPTFRGE